MPEAYLRGHESLTAETTLSGRTYLEMLVRARTLGFEIVPFYVGTENVEINLFRIQKRVRSGGHDVPEHDIPEADVRRRYLGSLENLSAAVRRADQTIRFDNSANDSYRLVGLLSPPAVRWFEPLPTWAAMIKDDKEGCKKMKADLPVENFAGNGE